jgi:hypothetical protein
MSAEFKMEQMSDTLRSLNAIFKTMQHDGGTTKNADFASKIFRLEKENEDLSAQCIQLDKVKEELTRTKARLSYVEKEYDAKESEVAHLQQELAARDEAISGLMEREALRNAEIEKLKLFAKMQEEQEDAATVYKEQATSVLCIKCKKSLDDLSNIRAAILGGMNGSEEKLPCEYYRVLLPNFRGRKPDRSNAWLRSCMRGILFTKMREDYALHSIKGEMSRFPQYVYAWFDRLPDASSTVHVPMHGVPSAQMKADDDRYDRLFLIHHVLHSFTHDFTSV